MLSAACSVLLALDLVDWINLVVLITTIALDKLKGNRTLWAFFEDFVGHVGSQDAA